MNSLSGSFLKVSSIAKFYEQRTVLRSLSLELGLAKIVRIHGENGAGKSTLLRIISGLLAPDSGKVEIAGNDLKNPDYFQKIKKEYGIAYFNSFSQMYSHLSLKENLLLAATLNEVQAEQVLLEADRLALTRYLDNMPRECSSGTLKKAALLRTFMHRPKLLLLDEPFVHLDRDSVQLIKKIILSLAEFGSLILLVAHESIDLGEDNFKLENGVLIKSN